VREKGSRPTAMIRLNSALGRSVEMHPLVLQIEKVLQNVFNRGRLHVDVVFH
jgi:hypothetical protein